MTPLGLAIAGLAGLVGYEVAKPKVQGNKTGDTSGSNGSNNNGPPLPSPNTGSVKPRQDAAASETNILNAAQQTESLAKGGFVQFFANMAGLVAGGQARYGGQDVKNTAVVSDVVVAVGTALAAYCPAFAPAIAIAVFLVIDISSAIEQAEFSAKEDYWRNAINAMVNQRRYKEAFELANQAAKDGHQGFGFSVGTSQSTVYDLLGLYGANKVQIRTFKGVDGKDYDVDAVISAGYRPVTLWIADFKAKTGRLPYQAELDIAAAPANAFADQIAAQFPWTLQAYATGGVLRPLCYCPPQSFSDSAGNVDISKCVSSLRVNYAVQDTLDAKAAAVGVAAAQGQTLTQFTQQQESSAQAQAKADAAQAKNDATGKGSTGKLNSGGNF